jgi:hypothetical protein
MELVKSCFVVCVGMVPKPAGKVAQNGEVLGPQHHHGGVWAVRRHGAPLPATPRDHPEERQGEQRVRGTLAPR